MVVRGSLSSKEQLGHSEADAGSAAAFRAFWAKFTIATAKRAPEHLRGPVLNAVGTELREEIRSASTFEWQTARVFADLTEAISRCSPEVARGFWSYSLRQSISQPLIRTLVEGGVQLFGRSPEALYKRTPRAWSLMSRNCGSMSLEREQPGSCLMRIHDVPPVCRRHDGLLIMWAGGFQGQAEFCLQDCAVEVFSEDFRTTGTADFVLRW